MFPVSVSILFNVVSILFIVIPTSSNVESIELNKIALEEVVTPNPDIPISIELSNKLLELVVVPNPDIAIFKQSFVARVKRCVPDVITPFPVATSTPFIETKLLSVNDAANINISVTLSTKSSIVDSIIFVQLL